MDIPHIPHNTSADAVGKPEGLSGSQVENSSLFMNNISTQSGNVNKNGLTDSPQIADGSRQNAKIGKIVPRKKISGK